MATKIDLDLTTKLIRESIEAGKISEASELLAKLDTKSLTRTDLLQVAHYYRRIAQPLKSIELLRSFVHPTTKGSYEVRDDELLEYAAALTGLGAVREARKTLNDVSDKSSSRYKLFQAFNSIREWDYRAAIKPLEENLTLDKDPYTAAVGKVNLLQAYLYCGELSKSLLLLEKKEWQEELLKKKQLRLLGNLEELKAQYYFQVKNWEKAKDCLEKASAYLQNSVELENLFVKKWQFLVSLYQKEVTSKEREEWIKLRAIAKALQHQETMRDLDYHFAIRTDDKALLKYIYWGTPHQSYKEKIIHQYLKIYKIPLEVGESYSRLISSTDSGPVFESSVPEISTVYELNVSLNPQITGLKEDSLLRKLFVCLNGDFYRGISLYSLHEQIYEGEYFNPQSGPDRITQLVFRLREWLDKNDIQLEVFHENNSYLLKAKAGISLQILSCSSDTNSSLLPIVRKAYELYLSNPFKLTELANKIKVPQRTVSTQIKEAVELKQIEKIASGPQTQYRVSKL
jgi:tetratricopeptide (TPR) repeat protein